jgi:hypothetical protein
MFTAPEDPVPYGTAVRVNNERVTIYTPSGIYEVTGDDPPFGIRNVVSGIGSLSTVGTVYLDNVGVIFPGKDRPYVHLGGPNVRPLGVIQKAPGLSPVEDLYQEYDPGRIKDACAFVVNGKGRYLLTFGTDGSPVGDRTLAWEFDLPGGGAWAEYANRVSTTIGEWLDASGGKHPVRGDDLGNVWEDDIGNSEGCFGATPSGAVTSATRKTVEVSGLSLGTVAPGTPVLIKNKATKEVVYRNRFVSYSGTTLTVLYPWSGDVPTTLHNVEVGSIERKWESGWFSLLKTRMISFVSRLFPLFSRQTQAGGTMKVSVGINQSASLRTISTVVPLNSSQESLQIREADAVTMKVVMEATEPGTDLELLGYDIELQPKDYKEVKGQT